MRLRKLMYLPAVIICMMVLSSCGEKTKETLEDVGNKIDTLTKNVGKEIDTLTKKVTTGADSIFSSIKVTESDTTIADKNFRSSLNGVFKDYLDIKDAIAENDSSEAAMQSNQLKKTLANVKGDSLKGKLKTGWSGLMTKVQKAADNVAAAKNMENQRSAFAELSEAMTNLVKTYGLSNMTVYRLYCATGGGNRGGYWLVDSKDSENPYGRTATKTAAADDKTAASENCAEVKEAWKFN